MMLCIFNSNELFGDLHNTYSKTNNPKNITAPAILPFAGSFVIIRMSMTGSVFSTHAH